MPFNVVGDFARLPRRDYPVADKAIYLSADRDLGNVLLRWEALEQQLGCGLAPVSRDLCEVATYVYLADKALVRGRFDDWSRKLAFLIPVRKPRLWNRLKPLLQNTVAMLTGDSVSFQFVNREPAGDGNRIAVEGSKPPLRAGFSDCVSLFSGGLDSYAGAVHLLKSGRRPAFVSHFASPSLRTLQARLMSDVQSRFDSTCEHLQYRITSRRTARTLHAFERRESSHRARSFLFLSFAAVVAAARGLSEIFICENGVLALNVPISEARQGTRCSRHAHPSYLRNFTALVEALFEAPFAVRNPFLFWTKREETELILAEGLGASIRETVSCWNYPNFTLRYKNANHCGFCIPCIVRRLSVDAAGAIGQDDGYVFDIFSAEGTEHDELRRNMADLSFFCRCLARESVDKLVYRYPDFVGIEASFEEPGHDKLRSIIQVYKRFASDTLGLLGGR